MAAPQIQTNNDGRRKEKSKSHSTHHPSGGWASRKDFPNMINSAASNVLLIPNRFTGKRFIFTLPNGWWRFSPSPSDELAEDRDFSSLTPPTDWRPERTPLRFAEVDGWRTTVGISPVLDFLLYVGYLFIGPRVCDCRDVRRSRVSEPTFTFPTLVHYSAFAVWWAGALFISQSGFLRTATTTTFLRGVDGYFTS